MASDGRAEFDPKEIARAAFPTAFRGYDQEAVHRYLTRLAAAIGRAQQAGKLGAVDKRDEAAQQRAVEAEYEVAELRSRVHELEELVEAQAYAAEEAAAAAAAMSVDHGSDLDGSDLHGSDLDGSDLEHSDLDVRSGSQPRVDDDEPEVAGEREGPMHSLDEADLIEQLGHETARIVEAARSAASDIAQRAEEEASLLVADARAEARAAKAEAEEFVAAASAEADEIAGKAGAEAKKMEARVRADAKRSREHAKAKADKLVADAAGRAESDLAAARQRANQIVADAEQLREEILGDLVRRRRVNQEHLDRLTAARDRLAQALGSARSELDDVASEIHLAIPNSILDLTHDEEPSHRASDSSEVAELVSQLQGGPADASVLGPGSQANGWHSSSEHADNGQSANGQSVNGQSVNGQSVNGQSVNGQSANGQSVNGHAGSGWAEGISDYRADASPFDESYHAESHTVGVEQLSGVDLDRIDVDQTLELANSASFTLSETQLDVPGAELIDDASAIDGRFASPHDEAVSDEDIIDAIVIIDTDVGEPLDAEESLGETFEEAGSIDGQVDGFVAADAIDPLEGVIDVGGRVDEGDLLDQLGPEVEPVLGSESGAMHRSATRGDLPRNTPFAGRLPPAFEGRDIALARSTSGFRRRLKRAVNDDQSDALDRLRAGRGPIEANELPPLQEQLDGYVAALRPALCDVVTSGGELLSSADLPVAALDNLCLQLAKHIVDNLRLPTIAVIEDSTDGDREAVLDPIRAIYRDFRNTLLPDLIEDALHEAFALGLYYAIGADSPLVWAIDPRLDPDPICEENSASPPLRKGIDFPSGHARPLSMPGCRCLVVPAS